MPGISATTLKPSTLSANRAASAQRDFYRLLAIQHPYDAAVVLAEKTKPGYAGCQT